MELEGGGMRPGGPGGAGGRSGNGDDGDPPVPILQQAPAGGIGVGGTSQGGAAGRSTEHPWAEGVTGGGGKRGQRGGGGGEGGVLTSAALLLPGCALPGPRVAGAASAWSRMRPARCWAPHPRARALLVAGGRTFVPMSPGGGNSTWPCPILGRPPRRHREEPSKTKISYRTEDFSPISSPPSTPQRREEPGQAAGAAPRTRSPPGTVLHLSASGWDLPRVPAPPEHAMGSGWHEGAGGAGAMAGDGGGAGGVPAQELQAFSHQRNPKGKANRNHN